MSPLGLPRHSTGPGGAWPPAVRWWISLEKISPEKRPSGLILTSCYHSSDSAHLIPACTLPATQHSFPEAPTPRLRSWDPQKAVLYIKLKSAYSSLPPSQLWPQRTLCPFVPTPTVTLMLLSLDGPGKVLNRPQEGNTLRWSLTPWRIAWDRLGDARC